VWRSRPAMMGRQRLQQQTLVSVCLVMVVVVGAVAMEGRQSHLPRP
jgi:hypothetical protein